MPLFYVDPKKCIKDSLCVIDCPMQIITINKETGIPEPSAHAEKICIDCGHCVAICPTGAFSLKTLSPIDCEKTAKNWNPGKEVIGNYLKARRTIRKFKEDPVEEAKIEELIKVASYAPTGHNSRTAEWMVINGRDRIRDFAEEVVMWMKDMETSSPDIAKMMHFNMMTKAWEYNIDVVTHSCPTVIISHGLKLNPITPQSCIIAMSHLEIAAPSFGLGCCWGGFFTWCATSWKPMREKLKLPENHNIYGTMLMGYPKYRYARLPKREAKIIWK